MEKIGVEIKSENRWRKLEQSIKKILSQKMRGKNWHQHVLINSKLENWCKKF